MRKLLLLVFIVIPFVDVWASGFYISNVNGSEGAPTQGDAGSVFWNPSAMVLVEKPEVLLDFSLIYRRLTYTRGITYTYSSQTDSWEWMPSSYTKKGHLSNFAPFPYAGFVYPINERISFGLGFYAPFGSSSQWDENGAQRYQSIEGNILTFFGTVAGAYRITKNFSIGIGVSYVRSLVYSKKIYNLTEVTGGYPEDPDMDAELLLDNFAGDTWNISAGILYIYEPYLRIGLSYTSPVYIRNHGRLKITPIGETARVLMSDRAIEGEGTLEATYPQTFKLSADYFPRSFLRLRLNFQFVNWNQFDGFHFKFDKKTSAFIPSELDEEQDFVDSFTVSGSVKWWIIKKIAAYGGLGFDKNAIKSTTVGGDLYDANKISLFLGAEFDIGKGFFLRAGTIQVFYLDRDVEGSIRWPPADGTYRSYVGFFDITMGWVKE